MNDKSIKNFTRGGQTFLHNFRMVNQIINRVVIVCFIMFVLATLIIGYFYTTAYQRYVVTQWGWAHLLIFFNLTAKQDFMNPNGTIVHVLSNQILNAVSIKAVVQDVAQVAIKAISVGSMMSTIAFIVLYRYLRKQGQEQAETKKIRGDEFAEDVEVNRIIRKKKIASDIKIGKLNLPKNFEIRHVLLHGTQGTGKSALLREILDQIRKRKERALVYDKGNTFIPHYARDNDIIMNMLDERTPDWSIWGECRDFADYDSLAAGLIPMPKQVQDPFWVTGARLVFAASAYQMRNDQDRSMFKLLKTLLSGDFSSMAKLLKGTEAEAFTSEKIEKTVLGIKAMIAIYARYLKYLKEGKNNFSIKDWVEKESQDSWIFFSSSGSKHETLKPLITTWLDIAVNALMSLPDSLERRIWIILDELPTLNRLSCLLNTLAETRKFGGALVLGVQNIAMIRDIYGIDGADAILDLCKSKFFLNSPSYKIAQLVSQELGQEELEEVREGISYSESAMRSGISISKQRYNRPVVSASEIMRMDDLEFYARLMGNLPVTKSKLTYKKRNIIAEPFIARTIEERNFSELDRLIEKAVNDMPSVIQNMPLVTEKNAIEW